MCVCVLCVCVCVMCVCVCLKVQVGLTRVSKWRQIRGGHGQGKNSEKYSVLGLYSQYPRPLTSENFFPQGDTNGEGPVLLCRRQPRAGAVGRRSEIRMCSLVRMCSLFRMCSLRLVQGQ